MLDMQKELSEAVRTFISAISGIAQRAAADSLTHAFAQVGNLEPRRSRGRPPGVGRPKRTQADLDEIASRCHAFVSATPGLRIEQINKQLGTTTEELALPIRKMLANGQLSSRGKKRATVYFAGKKELEVRHGARSSRWPRAGELSSR